MGVLVLGHYHQARRILVEPVDDTRPSRVSNSLDIRAMGQYGIGQRPVSVPRRWMDGKPGRLVYDQDVSVVIDDNKGNVLG